jgi:hypothetical protein
MLSGAEASFPPPSMKQTTRRRRPSWRWPALLALPLLAASCTSPVAFYEKAAFADPVMDMAQTPIESHWYSKVMFSMEGSIGGIGTGGGGGCGCY